MNKILDLFDKTYVLDLFKSRILPLYPNYKEIKKIKIIPEKKLVWKTTYHVVIEFLTTFVDKNGQTADLPIYCSAHSNESRKNSFDALAFLWQAGFSQGDLAIPRPLFFSERFNGFFYRGVEGKTLYHYICKNDLPTIEDIIVKTAAWFAKLHGTPSAEAKNFNPGNSRVETVVPGVAKILDRIQEIFPLYHEPCQKIYEIVNEKEKKYFAQSNKLYLIHGDAHPQNVIRMSENKIAVIDFTDMCLADFTRDLGSFLQQLNFMSIKKINDSAYLKKINKLFLDTYWANSEIKPEDYTRERIANYYYWTCLRTATFFLLEENPEPDRARGLILEICQNLNIKTAL